MNDLLLSIFEIEYRTLITGFFLVLSLFLILFFHKIQSVIIFLLTMTLGYYFQFIDILGVFACCVYGIACYKFCFKRRDYKNILIGFFIFISSICLFLHEVPGFHNPIVLDNVLISKNAPLYNLYLNFDKALVAFTLLLFVIPKSKTVTYVIYLKVLAACSLAYAFAFLGALVSGMVEFNIKVPDFILQWVLLNLFITSFAEEAFFRGFIQRSMFVIIGDRKFKNIAVVVLSGLLFGVAHFKAGLFYILFATFLGSTYAYCYMKSNNILVPILAHFIFNFFHFTLFTYPYLIMV